MNPAIPILITAALEVWRIHANKPPGWTPSPEDWAELRRLNGKTAEDYEREAMAAKPTHDAMLGDAMASVATDNGR